DMFFTKMEKIKREQFPLLHTQEGTQMLIKHELNVDLLSHQVCFKAQLFVPFAKSKIHIRPLNSDCVAGCWIKFDHFNHREFASNKYFIPNKSMWVVAPHKEVTWLSHLEVLMEINLRMLRENAPMVWMKTPDGQFQKLFVVWW
ncbi:MAG: DUF1853 family protein, partial [Bacteroidota bacterium]